MAKRNLKHIFCAISLFVLLTADDCGCRNFDNDVPRADFSLSAKVQKETLFLDDGDYTDITLEINPNGEVAEICDFKIIEWAVNNDLKGQFVSDNSNTIDIKELIFKKGSHTLKYKPSSTGEHTINLKVVDEWKDLEQEIKLKPITVKQKKDFACSVSTSTTFREKGSERYYPIDLKIGAMDKELKGSAFRVGGVKYGDGRDVELFDEHFNPITGLGLDPSKGNIFYVKAPTNAELASGVPPTITATISCGDKITKYVSISLDGMYKAEGKREGDEFKEKINKQKTGGGDFESCQNLSKEVEEKLADLERKKAEINAYAFADEKAKASLLANIQTQIDSINASKAQLDKKKAACEKAYHDFKLALVAERKDIFIHQNSGVTLDISSDQEGAKAINYTITKLEIDKGHLYDGAGNLVDIGSQVNYGSKNLTFKPTQVGKTKISITVNNGKESEHTTHTIELKIHPVSFEVKAPSRESTGAEIKRLKDAHNQNEIFATIDLTLDKLVDELKVENWKIAEYHFSDDMQGIMLNNELQHHAEFALDPKAKNTFFVTLPRLDLTQATDCIITVEGPDGTTKEVIVSLDKIKRNILSTRISEVKKAAGELITKMNDLPDQVTPSGDGYNQAKKLFQEAYKQGDLLEAMHSEDLKQALRSEYDQLTKVRESLETAKNELNKFQINCEKKKTAFKASLEASEEEIFSHQSAHLMLDFLPFDTQEDEIKGLIYEVTELACPNGILSFQENKNQVQVGDILTFGRHALIFKPHTTGQANIRLQLKSSKGATAIPQATIKVKKIDCVVDATPKVATEEEKGTLDGNVGILDINLTGIAPALQSEDWEIVSYEFKVDKQDEAPAGQLADSLGLQEMRERHIQEAMLRLDNELENAKKQLKEAEEEVAKTEAALETIKKEVAAKEIKFNADKTCEETLEAALTDSREKAAVAEKALTEAEEKKRTAEGEFRSAESMYHSVKDRLEELKGGDFVDYDKAEKGLAEAKGKFEEVKKELKELTEDEKNKKEKLEKFEKKVHALEMIMINLLDLSDVSEELRSDKEFVSELDKIKIEVVNKKQMLNTDIDRDQAPKSKLYYLHKKRDKISKQLREADELEKRVKVLEKMYYAEVDEDRMSELEEAIKKIKKDLVVKDQMRELEKEIIKMDSEIINCIDRDMNIKTLIINLKDYSDVSKELRSDKEFVLEVVKKYGRILQNVSEDFKKDREVVISAVMQNGSALHYASEVLRSDKEFILAVLREKGGVLKYVSEDFRKNREVVIAAVKQNGWALQFASEGLRKDREVVLAAVKQNGWALQFASDEFKKDKEVVEVVLVDVRKPRAALGIVRQSMKEDKDVIVDKISNYLGITSYGEKLLKLDNSLFDCSYAIKRKKIDLNNAKQALAKAQDYFDKIPFFVQYQEAQAKLAGAEKALEEAQKEHELIQASVKKSKKELDSAELNRRKAANEKEKVAAFATDIATKLANSQETAKQLTGHVNAQEKETNSEKKDLDQKLKMSQRLHASRCALESSEPILLTKEKEQLSRIPLVTVGKNTLLVNFPSLRLSDNPTLNLKVKGPGETTFEKPVKLKDLQVKLLTEKLGKVLAQLKAISQTLETHKKLPVEGNNYSPIKECIHEAEATLHAINHNLAITCGDKWSNDGDILSLGHAQDIVKEISYIQENFKKLEQIKKKCRKKGVDFEANLTATDPANHSIYSHNKTPITLDISSDAAGATGMTYTVQQIEVKGELLLDNEEKVLVGTVLKYGQQQLFVDPCGQEGEVKIKLVVSNGKGGESCAGILLDSHKVGLKANLVTSGERMFVHQTPTFNLEITSSEAAAEKFTYTVKECKIDGGELCFKDGNKLADGSTVAYGLQELTFKPNIEKGKATIYLAIENGNGSVATTRKTIAIDPITFTVDASFSETKAVDKQKLKEHKENVNGNYLALDIFLTGVDAALEAGPWKLVSWSLKEDPGYQSLKELMPKTSFASLQDAMESIAIENSNESKLTQALEDLKVTQEKKTNKFKALGDYKNTLTGRIISEQKALEDVNIKIEKLTDGKVMTLVTINDVAGNKEILSSNKTTLGLKHRHFEQEVGLQGKRIERDESFYISHATSAQQKTGSVQLALAMKQNLAYAQLFAKGFQEQPTLLNSDFKQLSSYDLKAGESGNKFYLKLPGIGRPIILTLRVQGPNNTIEEVNVPLSATIYSMAKHEARSVKKQLEDLNAKMDDEIAKCNISSNNYKRVKELNKEIWNNVGEIFLNLKASYGEEWWQNPMFLSLKEVEQMIDEMMAFDRKKKKLDKLRKECKACKTNFEVKASLHLPELAEGEAPVVGTEKFEYAVLKIKLSKVDPNLRDHDLKEAKWKLLAWQCSDGVPRTIIDKDRHEQYEFELNPTEENVLYLKFPVVELVNEAKITLRIGVAGITEKDITLDLGPVQNAIAGKHISQFLTDLKKVNQEVSAYSSRGVRERDYYTLKKMLKEIRTKDLAYNMMCHAVEEKLNSKPEGLYNMLPGAAAKDLEYLIKTEIPKEQDHLKNLLQELKEWNEVIEACTKFAGTDREAIVDNIYKADSNGDYLVHKCVTYASSLDLNKIKFIIQKCPGLNSRNNSGHSPLHLAIHKSNFGLFEALLDNGASASGDFKNGMPCLVYIIDSISDPYKWVAKWLERGGSTYASYESRGTQKASILMKVVISSLSESTKEQLVRKLLDYGAYNYGIGCDGGGWSDEFRDISGWNALFAALERDYREIGRMLLDKGAATSQANLSNGSMDAMDALYISFSWSNLSKYNAWYDLLTQYSPFKEKRAAAEKK